MKKPGIKRVSLLLVAVLAADLFTGATLAQQPAAPPETLDALRARILAHVAQPRYAPAAWGIKAVSLDSGKTLFEHNAEKYFNPASNAKLYSTALALDQLGADYRIRTSLYSTARPDAAGVLKADLIVYGRGDPTFATRWNGGDHYKSLEPLAAQLAAAGVRRVAGDLIGDESFFSGPRFGSGWEWDDLQWYYGAEVSALSINDNALDLFVKPAERPGIPCRVSTGTTTSFVTLMNRTQTVPKGVAGHISVYRPVGENIIYVSGRLPIGDKGYTGYVAVSDPARLFVTLFKEVLARRGIEVTGRARTMDWKYREVTPVDFTKLVELGYVESLPVKEIVRETLKPSQNLYAHLLLLQAGIAHSQSAIAQAQAAEGRGDAAKPAAPVADAPPSRTTEDYGIEALNAFLEKAGIKKGEVVLEEGSGLSRRNLITPAATVELLKFMSRHRWANAYFEAMPIAGVDGTLEKRMRGTPAATNARAKTGTLRYVNTLSGYVTTAAGERLAFSILLNNYYNADRTTSPRDDIDAIVIMLAGFTGRSQ